MSLTTPENVKGEEIKNLLKHITIEQNIDLRVCLGIASPFTKIQERMNASILFKKLAIGKERTSQQKQAGFIQL